MALERMSEFGMVMLRWLTEPFFTHARRFGCIRFYVRALENNLGFWATSHYKCML